MLLSLELPLLLIVMGVMTEVTTRFADGRWLSRLSPFSHLPCEVRPPLAVSDRRELECLLVLTVLKGLLCVEQARSDRSVAKRDAARERGGGGRSGRYMRRQVRVTGGMTGGGLWLVEAWDMDGISTQAAEFATLKISARVGGASGVAPSPALPPFLALFMPIRPPLALRMPKNSLLV